MPACGNAHPHALFGCFDRIDADKREFDPVPDTLGISYMPEY